ncbi:MAG: VOC family protein [Microcoleus anatoxicus]|uniref:VOC family protein n=1 Tax=Microcoleus anatoxicus TaxID=2705319 RepID=UPI00366A7BAB
MAKVVNARHVGLVVEDLDRMILFYTQYLNFQIAWKFTIDTAAFREGVGIPDASARGTHLRVPGSDIQIEMIEYTPKIGRSPEQSLSNCPGFRHMAFVVDDIDEMFASLQSRGVEFFSQKPILVTEPPAANGLKFVYFKDPEGNIIELNQLPKNWKG